MLRLRSIYAGRGIKAWRDACLAAEVLAWLAELLKRGTRRICCVLSAAMSSLPVLHSRLGPKGQSQRPSGNARLFCGLCTTMLSRAGC